jgi:rSAM/selenodomain-associated transferase 2
MNSSADEQGAQSVSIVIPVLNDLDSLQSLIGQIEGWGKTNLSLFVIEGNPTPPCRDFCSHKQITYMPSVALRGLQLDCGAQEANGDILWFLHADSMPPTTSIEAICAHIEAGNIGGYFRFRFAGEPHWYKSCLAWLINLRSRIGVPYGDQGLFVTRHAYQASPGFTHTPLFEEVKLIKHLRQQGKFTRLAESLAVSPRRWERDGWIRRTLQNRLLALRYILGGSPQELAQNYRAQP